MNIKFTADINNPPIGGLIFLNYICNEHPVEITWANETSCLLFGSDLNKCYNDYDVMRTLAKRYPAYELYGKTFQERTEIDAWMGIALTYDDESWESASPYLSAYLKDFTYLVGNDLSMADLAIFTAIHSNLDENAPNASHHIQRWYNLVKAHPLVSKVLTSLPSNVKFPKNISKNSQTVPEKGEVEKITERKREGKFVDLPGAEMGKVVVRFPPEASGYLHIGHAKAALLNQYYAQAFNGKFIMRFDDTNPAKETVEFENVILGDLEELEIKPDVFTHTSNYFDIMLEYCEKLIKTGKAYIDDTNPEQMKMEREQKIESKNRSNDIEKNMLMWKEMMNGTAFGQKCCVRAKIDMSSLNGCMRDPTIYRCKTEPHPRTGTKYKVYPTYDFACPIVDAIENVTHTLRTMEYHDRDDQFYWFIDALNLRKPYIWEYSRLNMTNTVLSKRKLTWFVDEGLVDGWDDPRFPTVRGVIRRGMTVEALREFIIAQGSSKSVVFMNWDKIWAFNKKVIDPIAPRYTALEFTNRVIVNVNGVKTEKREVNIHPKNENIGKKVITISSRVYIDYADAKCLKDGENATFINWGNIFIEKIHKDVSGRITSVEARPNLDNKDYKKTLKLTWLGVEDKEEEYTPTYCVYFDNIISKAVLGKDEDFKQYVGHVTREELGMLGEPALKQCRKGDIIQLQRRGFFKVDSAYSARSPYTNVVSPLVLYAIPDGHTKDVVTSGFKIDSKAKPIEKSVNHVMAEQLSMEITKHGNKIREMKAAKAHKDEIACEVKKLLALKADYKKCTQCEWKAQEAKASPSSDDVIFVSDDKTRVNKVKEGVLPLLAVKCEISPDVPKNSVVLDSINKIIQQGDKVREMKVSKCNKEAINPEIQLLLALKSDYKSLTGKEYKADNKVATVDTNSTADDPINIDLTVADNDVEDILEEIKSQGMKVRTLKGDKAPKETIDIEVRTLLSLKAKYKSITGKNWTPDAKCEEKSPTAPVSMQTGSELLTREINDQGSKVREMKASGVCAKDEIDREVKTLLQLKMKYKEVTATEFPVRNKGDSSNPKPKSNEKNRPPKPERESAQSVSTKKQTRLGLEATKEDNLPEWYSQVITKGELIEYYDVSGCYILRPWSFAIWKFIKNWFDAEITKMGVKECYFPIFVSQAVLEKEKTHIADFAPEVAWVTKSGDSDLAEPIAVRPTSETAMYPAFAKWIQSYRDLPIRLNQWNNVVRWEFKHPQPFLRTREFLWQEGHTAFATKAEADKEVLEILDLYAHVYTNLLAIPVIKGRKTEKEKFAGGDYTTTVEAFITASGRAIQGATSHHLGQNFSRMFEIIYEDPQKQEKRYVYQNSWGITTRTIGVMIMIHADNQGLVLPPHVACIQAIIVPCGIAVSMKDTERQQLIDVCQQLERSLVAAGVRCEGDYRDNYSPGWKFNHWEMKGVPVRIEVGPKDLKASQIVAVRRDSGEKLILALDNVESKLKQLLETVHDSMLAKATTDLTSHTKTTKNWSDFCQFLDHKNILLSPFCGETSCEAKVKEDSARDADVDSAAPSMGAKSLCIPFNQPATITPTDKCIHPSCTNAPKYYTLFGRSY